MTYLETGVYRLSTLSPIHIQASAPEVYGQGFIRLKPTDDFLYIVDTPKLQAEIFAWKGLKAVEIYTKTFSNPNAKTRIDQVLKQIGYDYKSNIAKISKGIVRMPAGNRFMQSALKQHFVPGSSIKGAIKTAVFYHILTQRIAAGTLDLEAYVAEQMVAYQNQRNTRGKRRFSERFARQLLGDAFQSVHPREEFRNAQRKQEPRGPFTDLFKAVKVKDAIVEESSLDATRFAKTVTSPSSRGATLQTPDGREIHLPLDKIMTNLKKGEWLEMHTFEERDDTQVLATYTKVDEPPLFSRIGFENVLFTTLSGNQVVEKNVGDKTRFECFSGETTIEISIDRGILESFNRAGAKLPFSDLGSLMELCQNFAQAQWEAERQFLATYASSGSLTLDRVKALYADDAQKKRATLRVGWGTGMLGTTVALLLDEQTRVDLRNEVVSRGQHKRPKPAPKSRRFVLEAGQPAYPLGWIELIHTHGG